MRSLGRYLAELRDATPDGEGKLSQRALAERLAHIEGVHQGSLSKWERDLLHPSAGQLEAVLLAMGATESQKAEARRLAVEASMRDEAPQQAAS